jgi:transcriptional regulator with XRE-family HTH domain
MGIKDTSIWDIDSGLLPTLPTLRERFKWARKQRGLTQKEVALRAATTRDQINKIERTTQTTLLPRNIVVLAKVLEVPPPWLMFSSEQWQGMSPELFRAMIHLSKVSDRDQQHIIHLIHLIPADPKKDHTKSG